MEALKWRQFIRPNCIGTLLRYDWIYVLSLWPNIFNSFLMASGSLFRKYTSCAILCSSFIVVTQVSWLLVLILSNFSCPFAGFAEDLCKSVCFLFLRDYCWGCHAWFPSFQIIIVFGNKTIMVCMRHHVKYSVIVYPSLYFSLDHNFIDVYMWHNSNLVCLFLCGLPFYIYTYAYASLYRLEYGCIFNEDSWSWRGWMDKHLRHVSFGVKKIGIQYWPKYMPVVNLSTWEWRLQDVFALLSKTLGKATATQHNIFHKISSKPLTKPN